MNSPAKPADRFAYAALIVGATGIGLAPVFIRLSPVGAPGTVFWRMVLALPFFAVIAWLDTHGDNAKGARAHAVWWPWLLVPGVLFGIDSILWTWSIDFTTVANSTLLTNLAPVFVALGAWMFFGERPGPRFAAALVLGIAGVYLLAQHTGGTSNNVFLGDVLAAASALFYAAYQISLSRVRRGHSTAEVMFYSCIATAACAVITALLYHEHLLWPEAFTRPVSWWSLIGIALVSQVGGQAMIAYAFAHVPASVASATLLVQPVVAAGAAALLFGEMMGAMQLIGAALVIAGVVLARQESERLGAREEYEEEPETNER